MQITEIIVIGDNVKSLSTFLEEALPHCLANMENDLVHIFVNEKYYLRSDGLLMAAIILNFVGEQKAKIQIIVGGGGSGLLNLDWNVERNRTKEIITLIKGFCKDADWHLKVQKEDYIEKFEE